MDVVKGRRRVLTKLGILNAMMADRPRMMAATREEALICRVAVGGCCNGVWLYTLYLLLSQHVYIFDGIYQTKTTQDSRSDIERIIASEDSSTSWQSLWN